MFDLFIRSLCIFASIFYFTITILCFYIQPVCTVAHISYLYIYYPILHREGPPSKNNLRDAHISTIQEHCQAIGPQTEGTCNPEARAIVIILSAYVENYHGV